MIAKAYINGQYINSNEKIEIFNPYNNDLIGNVFLIDKPHIESAFKNANEAFKKWSKKDIDYRVKIIETFNKLLLKNKNILAKLLSNEIAKNFNDSLNEIERTSNYILETIIEYKRIVKEPKIFDEKIHGIKGKVAEYYIEPIGVVFAISPFNYPINLLISKIIPSLICGNAVVFKSATQGTIVTSKIVELMIEAGFDKGIINHIIIKGSDITKEIINNKYIKLINFTGSTNIGKYISSNSSMIPLILELGGKDFAIVLEDANIELVAEEIIKGSFDYNGQRCTAIKNVIVHKNIKQNLIEILNLKISKLIVGDPFSKNVNITSLISKNALNYAIELIDDAILKGANIHQSVKIINNTLFPIMISEVKDGMKILYEEQFAPILPIIDFENINDAINICNKSNYGLQASIFTNDLSNAKKIAHELEVATVNINKSSSRSPDILPFFGIKDSGLGVQGIIDSIYSSTKLKGIINNK